MTSRASLFASKYAYGYGRIGVMQQYLLSQQDIDRMLGAEDFRQLMNILSELKFTNQVMANVSDDEDLVPEMEQWLKREVESMVPESQKAIFGILWLRNDAAYLSYLLKQHHKLTSSISRTPRVGVMEFDPKALQALVQYGLPGNLPTDLVMFVEEMREHRNPSPKEIDDAVAMFMARLQMKLADMSESALIREYVAHTIDLQNIRTARRLSPEDDPVTHLLPGGEIDPRKLVGEPAQLASVIRQHSTLPLGVAESVEFGDDTSVALERGLASAIAHNIALMREVTLGIEPIFAFALIALSQIKILRTIAIGKTVRLSGAEIREMLPPFLTTSPFES